MLDSSSVYTELLRGGSWLYSSRYCRSAYRSHAQPGRAFFDVGIRVVCKPPLKMTNSKLLRGGSGPHGPRYCRSAHRARARPDRAIDLVGFRVVCKLPLNIEND